MATTAADSEAIPIDQLPIQQLNAVGQQLEEVCSFVVCSL
jgi:hypothetical protein